VLIVDEPIEAKIRDKHFPLTAEDVRQAVVYGRVISAGWDDSDEHGLRLVVRATHLCRRRVPRLPDASKRG
jgi:hypothetical protein